MADPAISPKNWITGHPEIAARVDPTVATVIMAVLQVVLALGLHTQLGIDTETLFGAAMGVGMLLTAARQIQVRRQTPKPPTAADPPTPPDSP